MGVSGDYLSAKIGNSTIEGVMSWRVRESTGKLSAQTGVHRGHAANDFGTRTLTVDIGVVQDITSTPYTPIRSGTTISNLKLYRDQDDADPAFAITTFKVFESDNGSAMGDRFVTNISGEAFGNGIVAADPA